MYRNLIVENLKIMVIDDHKVKQIEQYYFDYKKSNLHKYNIDKITVLSFGYYKNIEESRKQNGGGEGSIKTNHLMNITINFKDLKLDSSYIVVHCY